MKVKKKWIVIGSIGLLLLIGRIMLPHYVTKYVNKVLADIPGYRGSIEDVDIWLIRGAYQIHGLKLFEVTEDREIPFLDLPLIDLSVEWKALFKGSIVGEVIFERPVINFEGEKKEPENTDEVEAADVDWTEPLKELMPLQINRFEIIDGKVAFLDFSTNPQVDISLQNLDLLATNLNNADGNDNDLPSTLKATATSIGNGNLTIQMGMNILKPMPDLDIDLKFENVNMPDLNDFIMAYSKVDVEKGTFNLYSEIALKDSAFTGYVKPVVLDLKVVDWKKDKQKPLNLIWQSIVGLFAEIFENQREDQFATKVPLEGRITSVDADIMSSVWNVFRNAFVKAFERNTDGTVNFFGSEPEDKKAKRRKE
jgi:hypothetical protein